jgi:hypothetical protein
MVGTGAYSIGSKMPTVLYAPERTVEAFTPCETGRRDRSKVRNSIPRVEALEAYCGEPDGRPLGLPFVDSFPLAEPGRRAMRGRCRLASCHDRA